jgi:hypothetical protein
VHAAAITRGELEWPLDRLPAIPSYELSGVVEEVGPGVAGVAAGDEVLALTRFDHDGVAADYTAVPAELLAPRPRALSHAESAAVPLPAQASRRRRSVPSRCRQAAHSRHHDEASASVAADVWSLGERINHQEVMSTADAFLHKRPMRDAPASSDQLLYAPG